MPRVKRLSEKEWSDALNYYERRVREIRAVLRGTLAVYEVPRRGYTERKIRRVADHTIKLIRPVGWVPPRRRRK